MDREEIESAISKLPPSEVARLAAWLQEFQAELWDKQIESDVEAGRLDSLIEHVDREFDAGKFSKL